MEQPLPEYVRGLKSGQVTGQVQQALAVGRDQAAQELGPKYVGKCSDRKQEACMVLGLHPLPPSIHPTCGDNKMDVGMEPQLAAPCVEDAIKPDPGPQSFGIFPELQQGLRGAFEQQVVHDPPVEAA